MILNLTKFSYFIHDNQQSFLTHFKYLWIRDEINLIAKTAFTHYKIL